MKNKVKQLGLRIPQKLDSRLENHVKEIGISKTAFILNLIFNELEKNEKHNRTGDKQD